MSILFGIIACVCMILSGFWHNSPMYLAGMGWFAIAGIFRIAEAIEYLSEKKN